MIVSPGLKTTYASTVPGQPVTQGDVQRLPFADGSFDGVVCGYALRNLDMSLSRPSQLVRGLLGAVIGQHVT